YPGLQAGRWLIVSGERADVSGVSGLSDAELVMIAGVEHDTPSTPIPNDGRPRGGSRTVITLAGGTADRPGLAFCYWRPTVSIYANVAHATHGETRREVLGSGDASKTFQEFALKQSPLTFVSAPTPDGAESTLHVRVTDVLWHETDGLGWAGPRDRVYVTRTDEKDKRAIGFGDGLHGLRPATGVENIRAQYRSGIGRPGNVDAGRISQLATRPLGVKSVVNPLRSSGGADADRPAQIRRNVPLATSPLDRLVSVEDYADFARRFAGIGKASAARLSDGHSQIVLVTIAGVDDIPIDSTSDLLRNLRAAFHRFGDPYQQVQVVPRESRLLVISAGIQLLPDYEWESAEPRVRSALLAAFGFDRRELGQSVFLSEVLAVAQAVPGVAYVDVDLFDAIGEGNEVADLESVAKHPKRNDRISAWPGRPNTDAPDPDPRLLPAQLAWLTPDVPDALLLKVLP
ncbi:MAG: putative baseplate assembly protein, partial [Gemmatimonadales bacterium]